MRLGPLHLVLGLADARQRHPRRDQLVVGVDVLERLLDRGLLVGRVVDDEVAAEADGRPFAAQQLGAQRVERRDPQAAGRRCRGVPATRCRISSAALLVKVTARISRSCARPEPTRCAMRWVMTRVLPEPAPARISTGPSVCSTAARCSGFSPSSPSMMRAACCGRGAGTLLIRPSRSWPGCAAGRRRSRGGRRCGRRGAAAGSR